MENHWVDVKLIKIDHFSVLLRKAESNIKNNNTDGTIKIQNITLNTKHLKIKVKYTNLKNGFNRKQLNTKDKQIGIKNCFFLSFHLYVCGAKINKNNTD